MSKLLAVAGAVVAFAMLPGNASAAFLLGKTIQGEYDYPNKNTVVDGPQTATVGAGVEFADLNGLSANFTDDTVTITDLTGVGFTATTGFNGLTFFDVNQTIDPCGGLTLLSATTGFAPVATFNANHLFFNFSGLVDGAVGRTARYRIADAAAAVPEPASWALFIGGFGAIGFGLRRRRTSISFA